jgi:threonine/homoserine/homoserine lactone efflux protein
VLGARTVRERHALAGSLGTSAMQPRGTGTIIREGFLVGATNPKGLIIFTAVLPQFIEPARGRQTLQLLSLGAICVIVALISDSSWALASGAARTWLGRSPRRLTWLSAGGGMSMIALGAGLALTGRRG